jgi:hypothetical protein
MPKEIHCSKCDRIIPEKRAELGYKDCVDCSSVKKYVGRRMDKHGDVEIYRENVDYFKEHLKRENRIGFGPTVPVSHPTIEQNRQDFKDWAGEDVGFEKSEKKAKDFVV